MIRFRWWCVLALSLCCFVLAPAAASAMTAYALNAQGQMLVFDIATPESVQILDVTGLQPGEKLLAIEFRPQDGRLYGISSQSRFFRVWPDGHASYHDDLGLTLDGDEFAMDCDPVTGDIRVMSNTGQNFRIDPITGEAIDGDPAPGIQPDTPLNPGNPDVRAAAFTNNIPGATETMLYVIDAANGRLRTMSAPNTGEVEPFFVLSTPLSTDISFDIVGPNNFGYLVLPDGAGSRLHRFFVTNGSVEAGTLIGTGLPSQRVTSFTIKWSGDFLRGITADNTMVRFHSTAPETILSTVPITGLQPDEKIVGIDFRPSNPESESAFALGSTGRLYRINPAGQTVQVGLGSFAVPLTGTHFGFNFDPTSDRIRIVTSSDLNMQVDPDTGLVVDGNPDMPGIQPDAPIAPDATIDALAYVSSPSGLMQPSFIALDHTSGTVFRLGGINGSPSPSTGTVTSVSTNIGAIEDKRATLDWSLRENTAYGTSVQDGKTYLSIVDALIGWRLMGVVADGAIAPLVAMAVEPGSVFRVAPESRFPIGSEAAGDYEFNILRSNTYNTSFVRHRVTGGTATVDLDYALDRMTHRMFVGQDKGMYATVIEDDADVDPGETIELTLEAIDPGTLVLGNPTMIVTIVDNDSVEVGPPTVVITSPPDTDSPDPIGTSDKFVTVSGTANGPAPIVAVTWTLNVGGGDPEASGEAVGTNNWTIPDLPLYDGLNVLRVTARDINGKTDLESISFLRALDQYSLAEGATGTFFSLDLAIANPNPVEAPVEITFLTSTGLTVEQQRVLPPGSRTTIAVDDIPGLGGAEVSAVVRQTSSPSLPLAVERTMSWDADGYGAHTEKAVHGSGSLSWLFAEGSQGFFETYFLLANPGDLPSNATVEMFSENGTLAASTQYPLAPHSRLTIYAGDIPGVVNQSFWTRITFTEPGIAERAMYFGAPLFNAGHESHGVPLPSKTWFHAEGATGTFFTTFLLLANPNDQQAQVTLTYLPASGEPVTVQKALAARSRTTINVALEDPSLANAAVAARVESSLPIVSERSMYWPGAPLDWYEAHNSFGDTATDTTWALAEGRIGGPGAHQTYILLANPGDDAATVTVMFLRENAPLVQKEYVVPPKTRFNIDVGAMAPELSNERFGAFVQSTQPIFVERAMYSNAGGTLWSAGTNATATRIP